MLWVVVATAAHAADATSGAEGRPSRMGVGAYVCKVDCVVLANVMVLPKPLPLLLQLLQSLSCPQGRQPKDDALVVIFDVDLLQPPPACKIKVVRDRL
jgi:hypothetical protein